MTLHSAIKTKNVSEIRRITKRIPVADLANLLEGFAPRERALYFRLLKTRDQSKIFASLDFDAQQEIVESFTDSETSEIIGMLYADDIADLIEEVPPELAARILSLVTDKETKDNVNKILRYDDNQTGSIMTVDIVLLKQTWSSKEALEQIRIDQGEARLAHYFFVVDSKQRLIGYVAIEDLVFVKPTTIVKNLVRPVTTNLKTTTNKEDAALIFAEQDMSVLPVLNSQKQVMGMVFADDIIDVIQESAIDDFRKLAAVSGTEDRPYMETSIGSSYRSRIIWLLVLMISSTVASIFLDIFTKIADARLGAVLSTALVVIVPVVMDAAGNAGTQSSTLVIRGLATGNIKNKDYFKVVKKEAIISILIGFSLGVFNFVRLMIYYFAIGQATNLAYIMIAFSSSLALILIIFVAKTAGAMIPLLAKKIKLDPAILSGPLITTVIDAVATLALFGISIWVLVATGVI